MNFRGSVTKLQPHPSCPVNNNQTVFLQGITTLTALFSLFLAWQFVNVLKMFTEKVPSVAGSWLLTCFYCSCPLLYRTSPGLL